MNEPRSIRQRALLGLESYGLTLDMMSSTMVEMANAAGYHFVRIDREHTLMDDSILRQMLDTARLLGIPCQIRVNSLEDINCYLSLGASAIMVPHVESREQAQAAISAVKYAPLGDRGMTGGIRAVRFGQISREEYLRTANDTIDLIVQIESKTGIEHIDEILSLKGIDMVATGKADLSQSFGVPGQKKHPDVLAAEAFIVKKALEYHKIPTLVAENAARAAELKDMGVFCYLTGHDESIAFRAIKNNLNAFVTPKPS